MKPETRCKMAAEQLGAEFRISHRGVPYVLYWGKKQRYSVCYFGRDKKWRLFYPWLSDQQIREDFYSLENVKQRIETLEHSQD